MKKAYILFPFLLPLVSCSISISDYWYDDADQYNEYTAPLGIHVDDASILTLDVDWIAGDILIKEGEDTDLLIEEENAGKGEYLPLYYRGLGTEVEIRYAKSGSRVSNSKKKLEITIPSSVEKIEMDVVSSNVVIEAGSLNEISLDTVSGEAKFSVSSLRDFSWDSTSGNLELEVADSTLLNEIELDTVSGNADLTFDGKRGYNLKFDTISGSLTKEFEQDVDASLGKFSIDCDSVSGNLSIHKK